MKKSIIWLITIVMALTFGALLYFQITYLENMVRMRESQFSESVMRALSTTSSYLEKNETLHFLKEDINIIEAGLYNSELDSLVFTSEKQRSSESLSLSKYSLMPHPAKDENQPKIVYNAAIGTVSDQYRKMQEVIKSQYLYQKGLLNEVILVILQESGKRPVMERADSTLIRNYIDHELAANGVDIPFEFSIENNKGIVYSTAGYDPDLVKGVYTQMLFPNSNDHLKLNVEFPTKKSYIFSSVRFIIPSLAFTIILIVISLFTILLAFRQKKLSEMKTDFINNMTHELKTPISTISLAAQMLADDSVRKSSSSLKHLSQVINDESKRLRFQVEKVLQMSVLDNSNTSLKFITVDANAIIENVIHTFNIKAEKFGGSIKAELEASNSEIFVDEMHFTNIIYNLLDNAIKYMKEDVPPQLLIKTQDVNNNTYRILISDNGIGIKKEDLKKIFEKFYRVSTGNRHDAKGFGLGLTYVKKMVELFGGTIKVDSVFGQGTTFTIDIPLAS